MKYLTVIYVCARCGFAVRVRTAVPKGKEKYALTYYQAINPIKCLRCEQRGRLNRPE